MISPRLRILHGSSAESLLNVLTRLGIIIAGVAVWISVLLVSAEVILRKLFGITLKVEVEYSGYCLAAIAFLVLGDVARRSEHIVVGVVKGRLPQGWQTFVEILGASVLFLAYGAVLLWLTANHVFDSYQWGTKALTLMRTPLYIPMLLMPVGMGILVFSLICQTVRAIRGTGGARGTKGG